jgi:hypothetical protein
MTTGKVQRFGSSVCKEQIGGVWRFGVILFNIMQQMEDSNVEPNEWWELVET